MQRGCGTEWKEVSLSQDNTKVIKSAENMSWVCAVSLKKGEKNAKRSRKPVQATSLGHEKQTASLGKFFRLCNVCWCFIDTFFALRKGAFLWDHLACVTNISSFNFVQIIACTFFFLPLKFSKNSSSRIFLHTGRMQVEGKNRKGGSS